MRKNKTQILDCKPIGERYSESLDVKFFDASKTPIIFNFNVETDLKPGFVSFTAGFNDSNDYDSTFILSSKAALKLGEMLIEASRDADERRLTDHSAIICEGKLSYMILKGWVDHIRVIRDFTHLDDYPSPKFYAYTFKAYEKDNREPIFAYKAIMDLQFSRVEDFKYWLDCFSNGGKVKIYFDNYDPEKEAAKEEEKLKDKVLDSIAKLKIEKDMALPPLSKQIDSNCKIPKPLGSSDSTSDFTNFKK